MSIDVLFFFKALTVEAKKESINLDVKITGLKQKVIGHKIVSENRIEFSKLLPFSGALTGKILTPNFKSDVIIY